MSNDLDSIPEFLKLTNEQRAEAWQRQPPRAMTPASAAPDALPDAALRELHQERQQKKKRESLNRLLQKKEIEAIPEQFRRWDPRKSKFVDARVDDAKRLAAAYERLGIQKQEAPDMQKIQINPYLTGESAPSPRARTTIKSDAAGWEIDSKVRAAALRAGLGKLERVEVVNPEGLVIATWALASDKKTLQHSTLEGKTIPLKDEKETSTPVVTTTETTTTEEEPDMAAKKKAPAKKKHTNGTGAPKGPGVIATIIETMKRDRGTTVEECVAVLAKKFPDRKQKSMTSTAKIQLAKNAKKKDKDDKRGLIYYG